MKTIFIIIINIIISLNLYSQSRSDANIFGHTLNSKSNLHIPYISISLKGTTYETATDKSGHYFFSNIPEGNYTIRAYGLGYKSSEKQIKVTKNKSIEVNFELDEDVLMTEEIVITSNRNETNRKETPVIISLITPELIEKTNAVCLAQTFNFQPGLRIENNCQNCGFQQVRINGLEGPYSQILIDSRSVFSTLAGVYGIEQIPVNMIDRVEIMRGGGSALFGSNAIAGTINIITKEPLYNTFTISNNYSSIGGKTPDNTFNLNGALVTEDRRAGVSFFGMLRNRKPYFANDDDFSELGKINQTTFGLRTFYNTSETSKLELEYHHINEFRRGGNLFDKQPHESDITEQTEHRINGGSLEFKIFSRDLSRKLNLYSSLQTIIRNSYYGAGRDPNAYGKTDDITSVSGAQYVNYFEKFLLYPSEFTVGTEYTYGDLEDVMTGYNRLLKQKVNIGGIFLQNEWKTDKISFLLGLRADKHNLINDFILSPRANFRYTLMKDYIIRLSYSTGYRAPQTFDEDLHITAVGGNVILMGLADNLKPEYSKGISGSLDIFKTINGINLNFLIEGFYTSLDGVFILKEVGRDTGGNIILERQNGDGANVKGVNLELRIVPFSRLNFQAGFTIQKSKYTIPYQWSKDTTSLFVDRLLRSPDKYGYLNLSVIPLKYFSIAISGIYTGTMIVPHFAGYTDSDRLENTDNFFTLNLKFTYKLKISNNYSIHIFSGMENLFNNYQKDFDKGEFRDAGYIYGPALPRSIFAGLKIEVL
ncbi:MAG: TonB-dependent receptor [Ignavibacteria bacterium]|nr:TonB-dependent receptor [Ignavibacteria bacterium]